jgi:hypothetical protein
MQWDEIEFVVYKEAEKKEIYVVVFMNAIHFHVRSDGWIVKKYPKAVRRPIYTPNTIEGFNR